MSALATIPPGRLIGRSRAPGTQAKRPIFFSRCEHPEIGLRMSGWRSMTAGTDGPDTARGTPTRRGRLMATDTADDGLGGHPGARRGLGTGDLFGLGARWRESRRHSRGRLPWRWRLRRRGFKLLRQRRPRRRAALAHHANPPRLVLVVRHRRPRLPAAPPHPDALRDHELQRRALPPDPELLPAHPVHLSAVVRERGPRAPEIGL